MNIQILGIFTGILFLALCYLHWKHSILVKKHNTLNKIMADSAYYTHFNTTCIKDLTDILVNKDIISDEDIRDHYKKIQK